MKIVHAADLHLDSPLRGLCAYEGAPTQEVRLATRRALGSLVDLCLEEGASLLLIAGDLYDGDFRDYSTALAFTDQMSRLKEGGTRVVWLRGNHDAQNRITKHLRAAPHVKELQVAAPETFVAEDLGIAVHGQGYRDRDTVDNLALGYPAPLSGLLNIGLLHTALDGRQGHAPYAPCTLSQLLARGYDYWALGHVHQREVLSEEPWVVFPGNLQGRHIRETGPKGATLIHIEAGRITRVEPRTLDHVRFHLIEVDASPYQKLTEVLDHLARVLRSAREEAEGRVVAARVRVVGATAAHSELSREREHLLQELRAVAVDQGDLFLERLDVATVGQLSVESLTERKDALGDLFRALADMAGGEDLSEVWEEVMRPLSSVSVELLRDESLDKEAILADASRLLEGRIFGPGQGGGS